ncbi:hypothetical protein EDB87DRAFT_730524 [Lactarius vividus]|nr:hypothetical protein EDB87DRAFT_730524 [Lactarius vividus]
MSPTGTSGIRQTLVSLAVLGGVGHLFTFFCAMRQGTRPTRHIENTSVCLPSKLHKRTHPHCAPPPLSGRALSAVAALSLVDTCFSRKCLCFCRLSPLVCSWNCKRTTLPDTGARSTRHISFQIPKVNKRHRRRRICHPPFHTTSRSTLGSAITKKKRHIYLLLVLFLFLFFSYSNAVLKVRFMAIDSASIRRQRVQLSCQSCVRVPFRAFLQSSCLPV